ncbi:MAG: aryl-sulfate sulfotransferase [Algibacter sp.]
MNIKTLIYDVLICFLVMACSSNNEVYVDTKPEAIETETKIYIPETNTLGTLKMTNDVYDGYTLFSSNKNTFLINNCGQIINTWTSHYERGSAVYLTDDGSILRAGKIENNAIAIGGIGGIIERFDWNGNLKWSYTYSSSKYSQHHDFFPLPNGNILLLTLERKTKEEVIQAGRNPDVLEDDELYTEQVIEIKPQGTTEASIVWQWDVWHHLIQDFDTSKLNYGRVKDNLQLININYVPTDGVGKKDWLHFNSLDYNLELDQILLSSQTLSEIYIIDHATTTEESNSHTGGQSGKGGDILYRWGNPLVYNSGIKDDQKLYGQHYPNWINQGEEKGHIMIFNNGLGRLENFSSVDIITPPLDSKGTYKMPNIDTGFLPENTTWSYTNPDDKLTFYSKIISSAQRLPNENTLICEGTKGHFFEINKDKEVVWEYINPDAVNGVLSQGESAVSNSVFRAIKYDVNHPAFSGKDVSPKDPIELNFNIGNCE